jgi:hypothetical protein
VDFEIYLGIVSPILISKFSEQNVFDILANVKFL